MTSEEFKAQFPQNSPFTAAELSQIADILNSQGDALLNERPARTVEGLSEYLEKLSTAYDHAIVLRDGLKRSNADWWIQASESFLHEIGCVERKLGRLKSRQ